MKPEIDVRFGVATIKSKAGLEQEADFVIKKVCFYVCLFVVVVVVVVVLIIAFLLHFIRIQVSTIFRRIKEMYTAYLWMVYLNNDSMND